jgi:aspartate-semialdehyde dehydrogenase
MAYKYPIDLNAIPEIDVFLENGYTRNENGE